MLDISSFYNLNPTELSAAIVVLNLLASFGLSLIIVYIYRKTRHGLSYSQSFITTLIMMAILGTSLMMIVQNNIIGAFAILGAFTLIRFRTIIKESSDIAFIFFTLVTGVAVGMYHYSVALLTVLVLGGIMLLLNKFAFGSVSDNFDYLLLRRAPKSFKLKDLAPIFDMHTAHRELIASKAFGDDLYEYSVSVKLKDVSRSEDLLEELKRAAGLTSFELITGKSTSEY